MSNEVSKRDLVESIDWLANTEMERNGIDLDVVDWGAVEEDGTVKLWGYYYEGGERFYLSATITVGDVKIATADQEDQDDE